MISRQDIDTFCDQGFVIKRSLLADQARRIARWTNEIAGWPEVPGQYMMYFEASLVHSDQGLLSRIENFVPYHAGFRKLLTGTLLSGATLLFGEPAVLFKDKINFRLPGAGGFTAHQDVQAGWDRYANLHMTAMVTIDPTTSENGVLEIVSRHHRRGLIGRMWKPLSVFRFLDAPPLQSEPERRTATRALHYL